MTRQTSHPEYGDLFSYETEEPLSDSVREIVEDAVDLVYHLAATPKKADDVGTIMPNESYRVRILFTNPDLYCEAVNYLQDVFRDAVVTDVESRYRDEVYDFEVVTFGWGKDKVYKLTFEYERQYEGHDY